MNSQIEKAIKPKKFSVILTFIIFCTVQVAINVIHLQFYLDTDIVDIDLKLATPIAILGFIWPLLMQFLLKEKTSGIIGKIFEMIFVGLGTGQLISFLVWFFIYQDSKVLQVDSLIVLLMYFVLGLLIFSIISIPFFLFPYLLSFGILKLYNYFFKTKKPSSDF